MRGVAPFLLALLPVVQCTMFYHACGQNDGTTQCPTTFNKLFELLKKGTPCHFLPNETKRAQVGEDTDAYYFNDTALCEPGARNVSESSGLYVRRRGCEAGFVPNPAKKPDTLDTICVQCAPGKFRTGLDPLESSCQDKKDACSGSSYDTTAQNERTRDRNCTQEEALRIGFVPTCASAADTYTYSQQRYHRVTHCAPRSQHAQCQGFSHAQPVLLHLWKEAGFELPVVHDQPMLRGFSSGNITCLMSCNAGYAESNGTCVACGAGKYKTHSGTTAVQVLLEGGAGREVNRIGQRWYKHEPCVECAAGTYQPYTGQSSCLECPEDYFCAQGAANKTRCAVPGQAAGFTPADICDPNTMYITTKCARRSTQKNCALCPNTAETHKNTWQDSGHIVHCSTAESPDGTSADSACPDGQHFENGACTKCTALGREPCANTAGAEFWNTACKDGSGVFCEVCPTAPGKRLLRSADDVCKQECDDEPDANGFIFLTPARVRELGATPKIGADACQKARAQVLNCDIETVVMKDDILQCTEPEKCTRQYLVEHVPRNKQSSACGCLMGLWGTDKEGCRPCPTHMTSLPGTISQDGCFCRAGYAELSDLSTGYCRPCGHDQEYGRTHYCPGGFSNYSRDIAPFRLEHARGGESVRLCAGGTEPEHGRCRCPDGAPNVHKDFQFASSSWYCSVAAGMRIDAITGNTTNCETLPLVEFTDACNWACVPRAVKNESGQGCRCVTGTIREENACVCVPGYYMQAGECVPCPANYFCTGGWEDKKQCAQDRSSSPQTVKETDCRCRAGYYFHSMTKFNILTRCKFCPIGSFCQPRCVVIGDTDNSYGKCECPDFFKCHEEKQDRPYECNKGDYYSNGDGSCLNGKAYRTDLRLWHNGLNDTADDEYTSINPVLSEIIQGINFSGFLDNGVYVLADVPFVCRQRETLVALNPTALLQQHGVQFVCEETPGRVNAGHSVPSWLYDELTHAYTLVHELYKAEKLPVLTLASAHLAWSQVLSCASTTTAEVLSEIDACHHDALCPQGLALQRADAPAGSLPAGSLLVALGPQTHRAWGLPLGATCVGATQVQPAAGLHFAVHCVAGDGVHSTHEHSTVRLRAGSGTVDLYAWTSLVVEPWQYTPARYHGQRMVLSVLCGRDTENHAPELALHTIIGGGRGYATRIKLEVDAPSGICSGVRPAHVVDRWKQRLYLFGESELLSIDIASIDVDTHSRSVHQIHPELPISTQRRAAWLYNVPYGSLLSENRTVHTPRALAVLSIVQESMLELHWWDKKSRWQNKTLALSGAIIMALQANMNTQPMRAVWNSFASSTFRLYRVISLNSEAQDHEGPLPLDVLAHGTLAQSLYAAHSRSRSIAVDAQVLLRFAHDGTLQLARLVHLTPGAGSVYGLEYQWVPFSHGAHDNVLQVQGRVLIAFGTRTALLHTLAVAHFGCAECEKHERWDADNGGCVCEKGSLAVCEPCTVPLECNPHRTVYNTSASGCTVATGEDTDGSDAVVYQQRCAGCGEGGPFYCPDPWTQTKCPSDRPVSLSTTGRSHTSVECQCPAMQARLVEQGGQCAPCPPYLACTPDSSEQRCPANAGVIKLEPASPPERLRKRVVCQCNAGFEQTSQITVPARGYMQTWPAAFINSSDPPGTDILLVTCRRKCPAHAICDQDNIFTACADNYKFKQGRGCEECNRTEVCRGGNVTQCHGPPARNATGAVRFCPCQNSTAQKRFAQTWSPIRGCTPCRAGHYCDEHGGERPCPANTKSSPGSSARSDCRCKPGFYSPGGSNASNASCAECPPGFYCPGAGGGILQCGDGKDSPPRASSVAQCNCRDAQKKGESCDRCRGLSDSEGACLPCADPAVATYKDGDTDECTHCQPGFWLSKSKDGFTNGREIHAQLFQHGLLENPFADEFRNAWAQYEDKPSAACRVCPPLFWCSGGNARPKLLRDLDGNTSSFTLLPVGGESPTLSFPCPAHPVERGRRRGTRGYGLSSCFQEASTWDGRALAEQVHDKNAPGVVHIDPLVHGSSLISALINQDRTQVLELIAYVDLPNPPWTFTRLASGTYEFVFEIDVVALAQRYLVDLRKLLQDDVLPEDADVWAATLMPSLWALHNNHKRSSTSRLQGAAQIVVGHLAHNRRAAALAHKVTAAVARQLGITAPPPTPEFRLGAESLPELTEETARARLGAMHYVWRQKSVLFVATYQAAARHALPPVAAPPPRTTVLSPDMAAVCTNNTVPIRASLGSSVVRVCMACLHGKFFYDDACELCSSVSTSSAEQKLCSNEMKNRGFTEPCTWRTGSDLCHECTRGKCCAHCLSDTTYHESITEVDDNCLQLRFERCV